MGCLLTARKSIKLQFSLNIQLSCVNLIKTKQNVSFHFDRIIVNRCIWLVAVQLSSNGGAFTVVWYVRQHWNHIVSCTCSKVASRRCGRIHRMPKAASGWFDCVRIKSIVHGRMCVWQCWANNFLSVRRFVVWFCRLVFRFVQKCNFYFCSPFDLHFSNGI